MNWRDRICIVKECKRKVGVKKARLCLKHYDQKRHSGKTRKFLQTDPNEIIVEGDVSKVILRNKEGIPVAEAIIDTEDIEKIKQYIWHYEEYAWCKKIGAMHKLILPNVKMIDHKNRNKLDNRKKNLRKTTYSNNAANSGLRKDSTSKFKGVSLHKPSSLWRAYITIKGKFISLGYYKTPQEAAKAYDTAALTYFKNYAVTNKELNLL